VLARNLNLFFHILLAEQVRVEGDNLIILLQHVLGVSFDDFFKLIYALIIGRSHFFRLFMKLCDVWIFYFSQIFECNILLDILVIHDAIQITDLTLVTLFFKWSCFSKPWFFSYIDFLLFIDQSLHFSNVLSMFLVQDTKSISVSLIDFLELRTIIVISFFNFLSISCDSLLVQLYSLFVLLLMLILLLWLRESVSTFLLLPFFRGLFELQLTCRLLVG
jgi:hypothetical protein